MVCIFFSIKIIYAAELQKRYIAMLITSGPRTPSYYHYDQDGLDERFNLSHNQLTPLGKRMMYRLGRTLLDENSHLFNTSINTDLYNLYSSSGSSAEESLYSLMLGLTSRNEERVVDLDKEVWLPDIAKELGALVNVSDINLGFRQIPYVVESQSSDYMFLPKIYLACPIGAKEIDKNIVNLQIDIQNASRDFINSLNSRGLSAQKFFGRQYWELNHFSFLFESMQSLKAHNLNLTDGFLESDYETIKKLEGILLTMRGNNKQDNSLLTHKISTSILNSFEAKVQGFNPKEKLTVFSGETSTMMAFLIAMRKTSFACLRDSLIRSFDNKDCLTPPPPGSSLIFELYSNETNWYVSVKLNGEYTTFCDEAEGIYCRWSTFVQTLLDTYIRADFNTACGKDTQIIYKYKASEINRIVYMIGRSVILVLNLFLVVAIFLCWFSFDLQTMNFPRLMCSCNCCKKREKQIKEVRSEMEHLPSQNVFTDTNTQADDTFGEGDDHVSHSDRKETAQIKHN